MSVDLHKELLRQNIQQRLTKKRRILKLNSKETFSEKFLKKIQHQTKNLFLNDEKKCLQSLSNISNNSEKNLES